MRWLYHLHLDGQGFGEGELHYAPRSLADEGFVHASYRDAVRESARLYFPSAAVLRVMQIDPRRLAVPVEVALTPRGPMPHVHGAIPRHAVAAILSLDEIDAAPDELPGTDAAPP